MSTLRSKIDALKPEEKKQLMYAFEHDFEQYIELSEGKFIGVNVGQVKHLKITESAGRWAFGDIVKPTKSGEEG